MVPASFRPETSYSRPEQLARARRESLTLDVGGFRLRADPVGGNVIVVGESLEDRDEALGSLLALLLVALPIALLASSAIGYLVAGAALRPVDAMRAGRRRSPRTPPSDGSRFHGRTTRSRASARR